MRLPTRKSTAIARSSRTWTNVKNVEFVSKEEALEEYSSSISSNADATLSALDGQNPLPRSFRIEMEDPSQVEAMADQIKADSDFRDIVDDANPESMTRTRTSPRTCGTARRRSAACSSSPITSASRLSCWLPC